MDLTDPQRILPFIDLSNFRDVGGYAGIDGRRVRWRRLFRSDSLHRLGAADRQAFAALGVRTVIDLRRPHEIERDGRVPAFVSCGYHNIHPRHATWEGIPHHDGVSLGRWLADRYMSLAAQGKEGLASAISLIAEAERAPTVVHCLAGKDRTGVVCALTLSLLGVCDEDIAADYALSTRGSDRLTGWLRGVDPSIGALPPAALASPAEAIVLFLTDLRERYGSVERYLAAGGLGHDEVDALRANLLS